MIYSLLADMVLLLHAAFVLFAGLGGLLVLKWPRLAWGHLPCAAWALWIEFSGAICPLTPLEQWLRRQAGEASYAGSFTAHYIEPLIYPPQLTAPMQWSIGAGLLVFNCLIYLRLWILRRKSKAD